MSVTCGICGYGGVLANQADAVPLHPEDGGDTWAHRVCFHLRDMIHEALPWCPDSIKQRIIHHAAREHLTLEDRP